ncbi:hypothetical protein [Streptomyces lavendulae]|uniref:hypothetical protein n=1 Tax=Streptomyces lavendulae TaxID=1914 RepID=UPI0036E1F471
MRREEDHDAGWQRHPAAPVHETPAAQRSGPHPAHTAHYWHTAGITTCHRRQQKENLSNSSPIQPNPAAPAAGESVEQIQPDLIILTGKRKGQAPSVASIYRALTDREKQEAYPKAVAQAHADFADLQATDGIPRPLRVRIRRPDDPLAPAPTEA